ncbi:fimbrial protein [Rahnella ecdela]|uniref:Fimbrial protein n=1 Tax=Rahnella ecdela TaxID=2816250 RepID=A0ABS6LJJ9_9GAMM|nr:fimbrial protein [Rahnella ecdela]
MGIKVKTINGYVSVPFGPIHNKVNSSSTNYSCNEDIPLNSGGKNTGGQIEVSVRLKRSVVGQSVINNVLIASTYWTVGDTGGSSHGTMATTNTYLNGTITVPQNCVINAGTQVVVELGNIYSSDFKVAGEKPANYTPKTFSIPVECNDMSATANLTLRLQGTPSEQIPDALQSDNKDVGVVVTDESDNPLIPNNATSVIPFNLDDSFRSNIILHAFPVGTTGTPPQEGVFTTLAYLRVDFS